MSSLMLPMGEADWSTGDRFSFLKSCQRIADGLGWCIGIDLKGAKLGSWAKDACLAVRDLGGRISWHPPEFVTFGLGNLEKPISGELRLIAETAANFRYLGLEVLNLHCGLFITNDPPEGIGFERYNSPAGPTNVLDHIIKQVEPLRELNFLSGGILHIENVDLNFYRWQRGSSLPTYLAFQTGSWKDLFYLAEKAGIRTVFDSEHFLGARNLLMRREEFVELPLWEPLDDSGDELSNLSGYFVREGLPPIARDKLSFKRFISAAKPNLFHLGDGLRATKDGQIAGHLPVTLRSRLQREILDFELGWIVRHHSLGAVIEVCGRKCSIHPEEWSERILDDNVAKMSSYLAVLNRIEELMDKGILVNSTS